METLREALERLVRRGSTVALRARPGGLLEREGEGALAPETLVIDEVVRFEGESDPGEEAVLFALRARDRRFRGTFVATYGTRIDPDCAAVIQRLEPTPS